MKKLSFIALILASVLFITSCGDAKKKEVKEEVTKKVKLEEKKADMKASQVSMKTKKFTAKFTKIDTDKNEKVSKDEFVAFSKAEFKEKDAKGNKDGKIQKEECGGFATISPNGKDLSLEEFVSARANVFGSIDTDNNGSFSVADFVSFKLSSMKKPAAKEGKCGGKEKKEAKMKCGEGKCGK